MDNNDDNDDDGDDDDDDDKPIPRMVRADAALKRQQKLLRKSVNCNNMHRNIYCGKK